MIWIDALLALFCLFISLSAAIQSWFGAKVHRDWKEHRERRPQGAAGLPWVTWSGTLVYYRSLMAVIGLVYLAGAVLLMVPYEPQVTGRLLMAAAAALMIKNMIALFGRPVEKIVRHPIALLLPSLLALPLLLAGWRISTLP